MAKTRVGVIRGGRGAEYDVSLKTGSQILCTLPENKYLPIDVLITKDGLLHIFGVPIYPEQLGDYIDVAFIALHGEYGEDGGIQAFLDELRLPYTGSGKVASALSMNKDATKKILKDAGVNVPYGVLIQNKNDTQEGAKFIFNKISPPWVIKPNDRGSSIGLSLARNFTELLQGIENCFTYTDTVLVEEYIRGKEATCGVIDNFRRENLYSLMPIEVIRTDHLHILTYNDKYSGKYSGLCPGRFSNEQNIELQKLARDIHNTMGLKHYSRSDFVVTDGGGIYALEVNALPGLTEDSPLPQGLLAVGSTLSYFIDHLVELALSEKRGIMSK
ncbi:MAG: ATP-grasp domain-containing protein [Patescibacteria group bacterium]